MSLSPFESLLPEELPAAASGLDRASQQIATVEGGLAAGLSALSPGNALSWVSRTIRESLSGATETEQKALDEVLQWSQQPTAEFRQRALAIADQSDMGSPVGSLALAAYSSAGLAGVPGVPVAAETGRMVVQLLISALTLTALRAGPTEAADRLQAMLNSMAAER